MIVAALVSGRQFRCSDDYNRVSCIRISRILDLSPQQISEKASRGSAQSLSSHPLDDGLSGLSSWGTRSCAS